ncbi:MAG: coiled-coil domain-containing protein [Planctomycetota bacterium]|jgi:hypothetical protein
MEHHAHPKAEGGTLTATRNEASEGEPVKSILAGVEQQFERLRSVQAAQVREAQRVARRAAELDRRQHELDQAREDLTCRTQALEEAAALLEQRRDQLEADQHAWKDAQQTGGETSDAEVARARQRLEAAETRIREQESALETRAREIAQRDGHLRDLQARIETLKDELSERGSPEPAESLRARDERIAELTRALSKVTPELAELQRQNAELSRERAPREVETAAGVPSPGQSDEHLRRRAARLKQVREVLRRRVEADRRQHRAQSECVNKAISKVRTQQLHVEEVRKLLVASEKQMIRKWARNRSVLTGCALMVVATMLGIGAWHAADKLFPSRTGASITMRMNAADRAGLSEEQMQQWQRWHASLLYDEEYIAAAAARMVDRLLPYATAEAVSALAVNQLAVDTGRAGELTLSIAQEEPETARAIIDVLSGLLVEESRQRVTARGEQIPMIQPQVTESDEPAIRVYTVEDRRIQYAGSIFGGCCFVGLALVGMAFSQWSRSRPVLDEYSELFTESAEADPDGFESTLKPITV